MKKGITEISPSSLAQAGIINNEKTPVKLLSAGDAPKGIKISVHAASKFATEKVNAA
jgi:ribosomal protein L15